MQFFSPGRITKVGGFISLLGGLITSAGETTYGPAIAGIGGLITAWAARQVNITSEQAGIKAPEVVVAITAPPIIPLPPLNITVEKMPFDKAPDSLKSQRKPHV